MAIGQTGGGASPTCCVFSLLLCSSTARRPVYTAATTWSARGRVHIPNASFIHQLLIVSPRSVRVLTINCTVSELHPASQSDRPRSEQLLKGALTVSLHRTVYVSHTFETYHEHGPKYGVSTTGDKKAGPTFGPRSVSQKISVMFHSIPWVCITYTTAEEERTV